jgi:hypothetical protein
VPSAVRIGGSDRGECGGEVLAEHRVPGRTRRDRFSARLPMSTGVNGPVAGTARTATSSSTPTRTATAIAAPTRGHSRMLTRTSTRKTPQ